MKFSYDINLDIDVTIADFLSTFSSPNIIITIDLSRQHEPLPLATLSSNNYDTLIAHLNAIDIDWDPLDITASDA